MLYLWNYFGPPRPAGIYNIGTSNERHGTLVQGIDYYDSKACIYQPYSWKLSSGSVQPSHFSSTWHQSMNQFESTPIHYPMKSDQLSWWNSQSIKPYHNLIQSQGNHRKTQAYTSSTTTAMKISSNTQGTYEGWTLQFAQRGSKSPDVYLTLVRLVWMSPIFF